jgi:nucleotide-binding universal stress UspA family protein
LEHAVAGHGTHFDTIVCAVDLGPKTEEIARWAGDFAATVGGRLFLLHIVPKLGAEEGDYFRADANLAPVEQAFERLTVLRDTLGLSAKVIVAGGGIPEAIGHQASELGADVVVAGRGTCAGRLGRLRSNAYAIIRSTPCAVITV